MKAPRLWLLTTAAILWLAPRAASAIDVPNINGHMTDPDHTLSEADKTSIEDKLGKIQEDTRVDFAGWIVDAPEASLDDLGNDAFHRWNIGRDWDNGAFMLVPRNGRVHLIQNPKHPVFTPAETHRVVDADTPSAPMAQRLDHIQDAAGGIIRTNSLKARPRGNTDPRLAVWYACGAGAIFLLASALSVRTRLRRKAV
jgi:hypothetical protein